jgi:hypothetical protein
MEAVMAPDPKAIADVLEVAAMGGDLDRLSTDSGASAPFP